MIKVILSALLIIPFTGSGQSRVLSKANSAKTTLAIESFPLKNALDSFSYALGINIATNLKEQGVTEVNSRLLMQAFNDIYKGSASLINMQGANQVVQQKLESFAMKKADAEKLAGLNFLNENRKRSGVKATLSGLEYEILKAGAGPVPIDTSTVKVYYKVSLLNGSVIDSSKSGPVEIRVDQVIPGWAEALKLMPVGSKWKVYIPFYLAFGDHGAKPLIPPGASLVYDVELVEIVK